MTCPENVSTELRRGRERTKLANALSHDQLSLQTKTVSTLGRRILKMQLYFNVRPNPSRNRSFSKTLFKPDKFENAGFVWMENILKTELLENDGVTIINGFP